jgi:hypothetical protein
MTTLPTGHQSIGKTITSQNIAETLTLPSFSQPTSRLLPGPASPSFLQLATRYIGFTNKRLARREGQPHFTSLYLNNVVSLPDLLNFI